MKNDVLSAWFKELCSLVFVQTFQAFLLAIVMSIIVKALASSSTSMTGGMDAVGVLAIIALASFSKMELLIKNLFGLTSGQGDPSLSNGQRSLMGGLVALGGLKRIADNGRKIVGGVGRAVTGHVRLRKAQNSLYPLEAEKLASGENTGNGSEKRKISGPKSGDGSKYTAPKASLGINSMELRSLTSQISKLNDTLKSQNLKSDKKDKDDKIDKLKAAIEQAKNDRNEGLKSAFRGVAESIGAVTGATTGTLYGMAKGDGMVSSALTGAGVGDVAGEAVANITINAAHAANSIPKVSSAVKEEVKYRNNKEVYNKIDKLLKEKENVDIKDLNKKLESFRKSQELNKNTIKRVDDNK